MTTTAINPTGSFSLPTLILTTTFTPPPACSTQFAQRGRIILNPEFPPIDSAQSTCYESQFMSWNTAFAYEQLVCPEGYQTQSVFDAPANYIACCPSGWDGLSLWDAAPTHRPAYLGSCYSTLPASGLIVTYSDTAANALSTSTYTPTSSGQVAYAYPYDGIAATPASTGGSTASPTGEVSTPVESGGAVSSIAPTGTSGSGAGRIEGIGCAVAGAVLLFAFLLV